MAVLALSKPLAWIEVRCDADHLASEVASPTLIFDEHRVPIEEAKPPVECEVM